MTQVVHSITHLCHGKDTARDGGKGRKDTARDGGKGYLQGSRRQVHAYSLFCSLPAVGLKRHGAGPLQAHGEEGEMAICPIAANCSVMQSTTVLVQSHTANPHSSR